MFRGFFLTAVAAVVVGLTAPPAARADFILDLSTSGSSGASAVEFNLTTGAYISGNATGLIALGGAFNEVAGVFDGLFNINITAVGSSTSPVYLTSSDAKIENTTGTLNSITITLTNTYTTYVAPDVVNISNSLSTSQNPAIAL